MSAKRDVPGEIVIFRRFRRSRGGRVLDAWQYGLKGWPIRLRKDRVKK